MFHYKEIHVEAGFEFICPYCPEHKYKRSSLYTHMRVKHKLNVKRNQMDQYMRKKTEQEVNKRNDDTRTAHCEKVTPRSRKGSGFAACIDVVKNGDKKNDNDVVETNDNDENNDMDDPHKVIVAAISKVTRSRKILALIQ